MDWEELYRQARLEAKRETDRESKQNRITVTSLLPSEIPRKRLLEEVCKRYGHECLLTGESDPVVDHFIPLSWGRLGNVWGNVFPISRKLNGKKHAKNPFEWVMQTETAQLIAWEKWKSFVELVAVENGLTVDELVSFTYWCDQNRRSAEDLKVDHVETKSIDQWRKQHAGKKHPKYSFFGLCIRQGEIEDLRRYLRFVNDQREGFLERYHPIIAKCNEIGKITFRDKGKYSTKFRQITNTARFYCVTYRKNGVEIEDWSLIAGIPINDIFDYMMSVQSVWRNRL